MHVVLSGIERLRIRHKTLEKKEDMMTTPNPYGSQGPAPQGWTGGQATPGAGQQPPQQPPTASGNPFASSSNGNANYQQQPGNTGSQPFQDTSSPYGNSYPQQPVGSGFFNWIRSLNFYRSTNRWIGGVSGAIANRLGWDPLIIRIIWFAFFCVAGFGALLYGVAWLLLPDERDGTILLEEAIDRGRFPGAFWMSLLFILIGCPGSVFAVPFISVPVFVVLVIVALVLYSRQKHQNQQGPGSAGTSGSGPSTPGTPYTANNTGSASGAPTDPFTSSGNTSSTPTNPFASYSATNPYSTGQQQNAASTGTTGQAHTPQQPYTPPFYTSPKTSYTRPAAPTTYRRKPAGPVVVGITAGLILLSLAALIAFIAFGYGTGNPTPSVVALITLWTLGVTFILGLITIVLGFAGRKSGGLLPITIIVMVLLLCLWPTTRLADSAFEISASSSYGTIDVGNDASYGPNDWDQLQQDGLKAVNSEVTIDLRQWQYDMNDLTDDHLDYRGCPIGSLDLEAVNSQITILIPKGCAVGIDDINQVGGDISALNANGEHLHGNGLFDANGHLTRPDDMSEHEYKDALDKAVTVEGEIVFSDVTVTQESDVNS